MLAGQVALVTGGGRGIGRAICLRLASMGALVYVNYVLRSEAAEKTVEEIEQAGGRAKAVGFDVSETAAVQSAFKSIVDRHGSIDILVNNAGITRDGLMARMKEEDWDAVLNTNLKGAFLCAKAASRSMMKKRSGCIVNIASVSGFLGNIGQTNYSAAKAGLVGLTKAMAREYAARGIRVNSIAPGFIETEMTDMLSEEMQKQILSEIPLARFGRCEDIAGAVAYLVSADGRYITGQTLHINGGMYM